MSDDRELLELAAKAAGYSIIRWETDEDGVELAVIDRGYWQPLHMNTTTDCMGDALRLAVKLGVGLVVCNDTHRSAANVDEGDYEVESHGNDPNAATRRAIVRAAAAIGKGRYEK